LIFAFAAMFDIKFAPEKLRAITTAAEPGVVILYDREWIPIVKPFGDKEELMKSLGISYNLILDWNIQFAEVASILGGRQAPTMVRAMAQGVGTLPQILYPVKFYLFSRAQLDKLTVLLIRPLRKAKMIGTRLHAEVLSNRVLGIFMGDVNFLTQEAKLLLFDSAMEEGGGHTPGNGMPLSPSPTQ
jgi:hypothetical protein